MASTREDRTVNIAHERMSKGKARRPTARSLRLLQVHLKPFQQALSFSLFSVARRMEVLKLAFSAFWARFPEEAPSRSLK